MNRLAALLAISTLALSSTAISARVQAKDAVMFGIVPQQAASRLAKIWVPFMRKLSEETGETIRFATMKDIPSFEGCLAQGAYDLAYMNPYHYTVFSRQTGYRAFAHQSDKKLKGLLVVRKDSGADTLASLDGRKIAFPSPAAFGASVLPRAEMTAQGLSITPVYVKSHDSVYRSVAAGLFPAGGGVVRTFNNIPSDLRDQLQIIYRTNSYTPHAFAAHPSLDDDRLNRIQSAMMRIADEHPDLVEAVGMRGFEPANDESWNDVRRLGLTQTQTQIEQQGSVTCRLS